MRVPVEITPYGVLSCAVARTAAEQARGLQGHPGLADGEGLLFPFDPPRAASFHMGAVSFPIDLLFADAGGRIARIIHHAEPGCRSRWDVDRVGAVIEVPGGWCARNLVSVGGSMTIGGRRLGAQTYNLLRTITEAGLDSEAAPDGAEGAFRKVGPEHHASPPENSGRLGPGYYSKEPQHEAPDYGGAISPALDPGDRFRGHDLPDAAFPEAMGGLGGDLSSAGWQDVGGYDQKFQPYADPLAVDMESKDTQDGDAAPAAVRMSAARRRAALAVDFTTLVPQLIRGALADGLPWRPTYVNPHREVCLVGREQIGRWIHAVGLDDAQVDPVFDAATSAEGLDKLAQGFLLADDGRGGTLIDSANVQGHGDSPVLVLTKRVGRMNFQEQVNQYRNRSDQKRARNARRAAKADLWARLPEMLGRQVEASGWNIPVSPEETARGAPIGNQHPGTAAVIVVRQALGQYKLPSEVELRYVGMKRISGHGPAAMDEGIVFVEANFRGASGPKFSVDVPVIVHEGRLLDPSIVVHAGNPRVLTQNTFDEILEGGEFTRKLPDRPHMFSPPPDERARRLPPQRVVLERPGMFDVPPPRSLLKTRLQASIRSAVTGFVGEAGGGAMGVAAGPGDYEDSEPAWSDTGDTGWGDGRGDFMEEIVPPEPSWADDRGQGLGSGGDWGAMEPGDAALTFLREHPTFAWSESDVGAAHEFAEMNGVDLPSFMDALNDLEYRKSKHSPMRPEMDEMDEMGGDVLHDMPADEGYGALERVLPFGAPEGNAPAAPVRDPLEPEMHEEPGARAMGQHGVAPPGREQQVRDLKHEPGVDNPYAVAWSSYNKSHEKHSGEGRQLTEKEERAREKERQREEDRQKPKPKRMTRKETEEFMREHQERLKRNREQIKREQSGGGGGGEKSGARVDSRVGFYAADVTGYVDNGTPGWDVPGADGSHLDVAERKPVGWGAGQRVRTTKMVVTRDRGGVRYVIPQGTSGTVLRDVDGANRAMYVKFPELGYSTTVSVSALKSG